MAEKRNSEGSETAESQTKKRPRLGVNIEPSPVREVQSNEVPKPLKSEEGHLVFKIYDTLNKKYSIWGKMGQGTFGQVFHCWDCKAFKHVAIKVSRGIEKYRQAARDEIKVLKRLADVDTRISRFVEMIDWFEHGDHVCIVLEKLGLNLYEVLRRNGLSPLPMDQIHEFGEQILESVACMHEIGLVHTDVKSDNVVLASSKTTRYFTRPSDHRFLPKYNPIKLIDFGVTYPGDRTHFSIVSTRGFRAPEVILGLGWTCPCDIWSTGCLFVELCTGSLVFKADNDLEHLAKMERVLGPLPTHMIEKATRVPAEYFSQGRVNLRTVPAERREIIESLCSLEELVSKHVESSRSSSFVDLLKGLLKYDPDKRLDARSALDHPFFKNPT